MMEGFGGHAGTENANVEDRIAKNGAPRGMEAWPS
jgi:hypothetical protein